MASARRDGRPTTSEPSRNAFSARPGRVSSWFSAFAESEIRTAAEASVCARAPRAESRAP